MRIKRIHAGFTFIELLVVLLIIGMVAGVSAPAIGRSARTFAFSQKVKRMQGLLKHLQRIAVAEQRTYRLAAVAEPEGRLAIWRDREDEDNAYDPWEPVNDSLLNAALPGADLSVRSEEKLEIIFADRGTVSAAQFSIADNYGHSAGFETSISGEISVSQ